MTDTAKQIYDHAHTLVKQKGVLLNGYDRLLSVLLKPENVTKQELVTIINDTIKKSTLV